MKYLLILFVVGFTACNTIDSVTSPSVCDILKDPRKYAEQAQLKVKGKVTDTFSLLGYKTFELSDVEGRCAITVVTDKVLPKKGDEIVVKGTLDEAFAFGETRKLVLKEEGN